MRVNGGVIDQFAGGIDHRHLHPGAQARVQTQSGLGPGRCGQQQILQVAGKHLDGRLFRLLAQTLDQLGFQRGAQFLLPGLLQRLLHPAVQLCRAQLVAFCHLLLRPAIETLRQLQTGLEHALGHAAQDRQCPV